MTEANTEKSAIAVVSTPLHMIYLVELVHQISIDHLEIIILVKRATDTPHIQQILTDLKDANVHWVNADSWLASKAISIYELFILRFLRLSRRKYDYGIFADYGRSILANIHCDQYYWIGDGTKLIIEASVSISGKRNRYTMHKKVDRLLRPFPRMRLSLPQEPYIYSPFHLSVERHIHNPLAVLKSKYANPSVRPDSDKTVFFFGAYFCERSGDPLMTEHEYIEYMIKISEHFDNLGLSLTYVPNRHENTEKIARMSSIPNIRIEYFDYPAEVQFHINSVSPKHVASFFSTCLIHFDLLEICESITAFHIDFRRHDEDYFPTADEVYSYLKVTIGEENLVYLEL